MTVLFCLLPEVHFKYTQFREWALLPSLGVLLLSEFVVEWKLRPKLLIQSQRLINYGLSRFYLHFVTWNAFFFHLLQNSRSMWRGVQQICLRPLQIAIILNVERG